MSTRIIFLLVYLSLAFVSYTEGQVRQLPPGPWLRDDRGKDAWYVETDTISHPSPLEAWNDEGPFKGRVYIRSDFRISQTQEEPGLNFALSVFLDTADFRNTRINAMANFSGARFKSMACFSNAHFHSLAAFTYARFHDKAFFSYSQFDSITYFPNAQFDSLADFSNVRFDKLTDFSAVRFHSRAEFSTAQFRAIADFRSTHFHELAGFYQAEFMGMAYFNKARFDSQAIFYETQFQEETHFVLTAFNGWTTFHKAQFDSITYFRETQFNGPVSFFESRFYADADFKKAQFDSLSEFIGSQFASLAIFEKAFFHDTVTFQQANFRGAAYFQEVQFASQVSFNEGQFYNEVSFQNARFHEMAKFTAIDTFGTYLNLAYSSFEKPPFFNESTLPDTLDLTAYGQGYETALVDFTSMKSKLNTDSSHHVFNRGSEHINYVLDTCRIILKGVNWDKVKFNYVQFEVVALTGKDSVLQENLYLNLMKNQKNWGFEEGRRKADRELKNWKWKQKAWQAEHDGLPGNATYYRLLPWINRVWWDYGYNRPLIFRNVLVLFSCFWLINFFFYPYLNREVYTIEKVWTKYQIGRRFIRWGYQFIEINIFRLIASFFYTMLVFFGLKMDMERIHFHNWFAVGYLFLQYGVGLFCLFFMIEFIFSK